MSIQRLKLYKSLGPHITVKNVNAILKDSQIFTIEKHFAIPKSNLFVCSIIANEKSYRFINQTINNGIPHIYVLAGVYEAFMERFQIIRLFRDKYVLKLAFKGFIKANSQYSYFNKKLMKKTCYLNLLKYLMNSFRLIMD
jgi:hypothetical protein